MNVWVEERGGMRRGVVTSCQVVRERDFSLVGTTTRDASDEGIFVATDISLDVGERLLIAILTPGGSTWVDAEGVVARVIHGRRGDEERGIGIHFTDMSRIDRALWTTSLEGRPPRPSKRGYFRDYAAIIQRIAAEAASMSKKRTKGIGRWYDPSEFAINGWFSAA